MKTIVVLLALFATEAFAEASPQQCINHARFAYSVALAKRNGMTPSEVKQRVMTAVMERPDLGIAQDDLPELCLVIDEVFALKYSDPDQVANQVAKDCTVS